MKMYSNEKPAALHQSGGVWFFNLNPVLIPGQEATGDSQATVDQWECDSVAIDGEPSRKKLIAAGMQARYSKDDEIAIINKKIEGDGAAYVEYSDYRISVKAQVDAAGYPKVA